MKTNIINVHPRRQRHSKGLNAAIEVFIIDRVVIVPDSGRRIGHLTANEENTIISRVGFDLIHSGASSCPGLDCGLHSQRAANGGKREAGGAGDMELTVRDVVKHVTLVGMTLAPGVFMRTDVCGLAEIGRIWIHCCVQVVDRNPDPMRHAVVVVAVVVVGGRWEGASKGIDPGA